MPNSAPIKGPWKNKKDQRKKIQLIIGLFSGLALLFVSQLSAVSLNSRDIASVGQEKSNTLKFKTMRGLKHTHKLKGPLAVSLNRGDVEFIPGENFTLIARVEASRDLSEVQLKWVLPDGMSVVSGDVVSDITNLTAGVPLEFELIVNSTSNENQQIHTQVKVVSDEVKFSDVAQYNTVDQEKINSEKEALVQRALDDMERSQKRQKIFQ